MMCSAKIGYRNVREEEITSRLLKEKRSRAQHNDIRKDDDTKRRKADRGKMKRGSETVHDLDDTAPAGQLVIFEIDKVCQGKPRL